MNSTDTSVSEAARIYADSLPPERHADSQEALRFARWFGEARAVADIRPADLEGYVESFGATSPNAGARADALKGFLGFAHKQKLMPERLVSHVRVRKPASRPRAGAASSQAALEVRITAEGRFSLEQELETLKGERPRIAADLHSARADGDIRENAPLDAARDAQGQLEARIREIEGMLRHVVITNDAASADGSTASIGCNVVIANLATGAQLSYQLVNAAEARPGTGRLSVESPVGQAIFGRRVGDEVEVKAPSGIVRFRIDSIQS